MAGEYKKVIKKIHNFMRPTMDAMIPACMGYTEWVEKWVDKKIKPPENIVFSGGFAGDSSGIRTPDTLIKRHRLDHLIRL